VYSTRIGGLQGAAGATPFDRAAFSLSEFAGLIVSRGMV
jgi:hypothetical protein